MRATNILPADRIQLQFQGVDKAAGRSIGKLFMFDGNGRRIDLPEGQTGRTLTVAQPGNRAGRPVLDTTEIARLTAINGPQELSRVEEITQRYLRDLAAYKASGGKGLTEQLAESAKAFLVAEGIVSERQGQGWQMDLAATIVTVPDRQSPDQPGTFVIQPAPVFGSRE